MAFLLWDDPVRQIGRMSWPETCSGINSGDQKSRIRHAPFKLPSRRRELPPALPEAQHGRGLAPLPATEAPRKLLALGHPPRSKLRLFPASILRVGCRNGV